MIETVTFTWYSDDTFHYMFNAEFVALASLRVPSGSLTLSTAEEVMTNRASSMYVASAMVRIW